MTTDYFERDGVLYQWTGRNSYRKCDKTAQAKFKTCKELHDVGLEVIRLNGGHDIRFTCKEIANTADNFKSWRLNK